MSTNLKLATVFIFLIFIGLLSAMAIWSRFNNSLKIDTVQIEDGHSAKVLKVEGELEDKFIPVSVVQVPNYLIQATLVTEDPSFYKHPPLTWWRVLKGIVQMMIRGKSLTDGSTIVYQISRLFVARATNERAVNLAVRKLATAIYIDTRFTRNEQLELYFNEMWYGKNTRGIGKAAKVYFNKTVKDLSLAESVILASIPLSPEIYSPLSNSKDKEGDLLWKIRSEYVLDLMKHEGYISEGEYRDALNDLGNYVFKRD